MELVDVDAVEAETLEAAFDGLLDVRGAGVVLPDAGAVARPADLGGDDEIVGIGLERLGDQLFGDVGAVGVGGVDEVDAELDGAAQGGECGVDDRRVGPRFPCPVMRMAPKPMRLTVRSPPRVMVPACVAGEDAMGIAMSP